MFDSLVKKLKHIYWEVRIKYSERKRFRKEFEIPLLRDDLLTDKQLRKDYFRCIDKYRINWSEYYHQYEFYKLNDEQRREYITRSQMQCIYRKVVTRDVRSLFLNKRLFLNQFRDFVHRKWIVPTLSTSYEELKSLFGDSDIIAKPEEGSLGKGIFVINLKQITPPPVNILIIR